jgi:hypothetical protein
VGFFSATFWPATNLTVCFIGGPKRHKQPGRLCKRGAKNHNGNIDKITTLIYNSKRRNKLVKNLLFIIVLVFIYNDIVTAQENNIKYEIKNMCAYRIVENSYCQIDNVKIKACFINHRRHYYFILDEYNNKLEKEISGTYLFNSEGELLDVIPLGSTMESRGVYFSPDGNYIGVDSGTWTVRGLTFYEYPGLEMIGHILYRGKFFWKDNIILYTTVGDAYIQNAPFDDNYYHFIEEFNLQKKVKKILYDFTELSDVFLHDFIYDTLIINVRYVNNIADWKDYKKYNNRIELLMYDSIK